MAGIEVLWWLVFWGAFGLCVGSFLNAVIYRLPRDISLREPLWSFCPGCHSRIRWYDNLPVISYVRLGGRCRTCAMPISPQYPLVEILGSLVVLLVFDAFLIAHSHAGVGRDVPGLTWQLSEDWPIFLAHITLFCALLAMSMIDIEHYWVDVRFTTVATIAGFVLHALWTPQWRSEWHRPSDPLAAGALIATAALALTVLLLRPPSLKGRGQGEGFSEQPSEGTAQGEGFSAGPSESTAKGEAFSAGPSNEAAQEEASSEQPSEGAAPDHPPSAPVAEDPAPLPPEPEAHAVTGRWGLAAVILAALSLFVLFWGAWSAGADVGPRIPPAARWAPGLVVFFVLIVAAGVPRRESDEAIIEAIEAEKLTARRVAALELLLLMPAILLGGITLYYAAACGETGARASAILDWSPMSRWRPLEGLGTAAAGFIIAGGIGWLVRLLSTFIMGKEAFGTGDIHMMAATGCVAGWPVVLIGFVLCSVLALAGWILTLPFKRSRAIPLGPWLSISFLVVVLFYDPIIASRLVQNVIFLFSSSPVTFGVVTVAPPSVLQ